MSEQTTPVSVRVTYPYGTIDTLHPTLAFIAPVHTEAEATVLDSAGKIVWTSDTIQTRGYTVEGPTLEAAKDYSVNVRVKTADEWTLPSQEVKFRTPAEPVIKLQKPANAARVIGPLAELVWTVEAASSLDDLSVEVDGVKVSGVKTRTGSQTAKAKLKTGLHTIAVSATAGGRTEEVTHEFYVWSTPQLEDELVVLDLREIGGWQPAKEPVDAQRMYELLHAAAALQGIVNRDAPRLMLNVLPEDQWWLDHLSGEGKWLEKASIKNIRHEGEPEKALTEALEYFRDHVKGLVVYDAKVWSTSNVASTVAGIEDVIPVRAGGKMVELLKASGLEVKLDLNERFTGKGTIWQTETQSTGSAKCDAYIWAKEKYLDTGKANPTRIGYWLDSFWLTNPSRQPWWEHCLTNHDWTIKHRGFIFDLSDWAEEAPQDDPEQPVGTDFETFKAVMHSAVQQSDGQMIHAAGFTPWAFKYTDHSIPPGKRHPVMAEWETVRVLSNFNAYLDADAHGLSGMANASLWSHMPTPDRYIQNAAPTPLDLHRKGYADPETGEFAPLGFTLLYVGDYDSAAWLCRKTLGIWSDPERGTIPMGWAINPNLAERMPPALHYAFENATSLDFFTAGDSGAGYVNPTLMLEPRPYSQLPSCRDAWIEHSRNWYRKYNYRMTGFLINGHAGHLSPESEEMTAQFSPDGMVSQPQWMTGYGHLRGNTPVGLQFHDLDPDVKASVDCMNRFRKDGLQFLNFRIILLGPSYANRLFDAANQSSPDKPYVPVDPWTWFYMLREHLGGVSPARASFTFDTIADKAGKGVDMEVKIGIRNDGWKKLEAGATNLLFGIDNDVNWKSATRIPLPSDIEPGESLVVTILSKTPLKSGKYKVFYNIEDTQEGQHGTDNPWWESQLLID